MFNWNDIKQLDLTDLDPRRLDLPKFDLPKFEMPKFEMPELEMPKMPEVDMPAELERAAGFARDAAYAGVGALVITAQKADERRRELTDQVTTQVRKLADRV